MVRPSPHNKIQHVSNHHKSLVTARPHIAVDRSEMARLREDRTILQVADHICSTSGHRFEGR